MKETSGQVEEDQATVETDKNKAQGDGNHQSSQEQDD